MLPARLTLGRIHLAGLLAGASALLATLLAALLTTLPALLALAALALTTLLATLLTTLLSTLCLLSIAHESFSVVRRLIPPAGKEPPYRRLVPIGRTIKSWLQFKQFHAALPRLLARPRFEARVTELGSKEKSCVGEGVRADA
jgi:hypothetical protein